MVHSVQWTHLWIASTRNVISCFWFHLQAWRGTRWLKRSHFLFLDWPALYITYSGGQLHNTHIVKGSLYSEHIANIYLAVRCWHENHFCNIWLTLVSRLVLWNGCCILDDGVLTVSIIAHFFSGMPFIGNSEWWCKSNISRRWYSYLRVSCRVHVGRWWSSAYMSGWRKLGWHRTRMYK